MGIAGKIPPIIRLYLGFDNKYSPVEPELALLVRPLFRKIFRNVTCATSGENHAVVKLTNPVGARELDLIEKRFSLIMRGPEDISFPCVGETQKGPD